MTVPPNTYRALLDSARRKLRNVGIEEFMLEGELILQHVSGLDAARLFAGLNDAAPPETVARLEDVLARRATREPLAYIIGARSFYGREFAVTPDVLIPRHETELLVERALAFAAECRPDEALRIADIGTGSGILAVTLALELPQSRVDAADVSPAALAVAMGNAERHGVSDSVTFHQGDLTDPLSGRFDVVVANLPYVRPDTLAEAAPELRREPALALLGGTDGLEVIRRLVTRLPALLECAGSLALLEADPLTAADTARMMAGALPTAQISIHRDLAGLDRCVDARL